MRRSKLSLPPRRDGPGEDKQTQQQQQQHSGCHTWRATETRDQQNADRQQQPATAETSLGGARSLRVALAKSPAAQASPARRSPAKTAAQPASPLPRSPWAHARSRKRSLPSHFASPCRHQEADLVDLTAGDDSHCDQKEQTRSSPPRAAKAPRVVSSREPSPIFGLSLAEFPSLSGSHRPPFPNLSPRPSTALVPPLKSVGIAEISGSSTRPSASVRPEPAVAEEAAVAAAGIYSPAAALLPPPPPPSPGSDAETIERPRSTYLRHFEDAVDAVMQVRPHYARLFTLEEREIAERFARLSCASKTLYVRLFQRKGPWFRVDGMLGYDEVGSGTPLWMRRQAAASAAAAAAVASVSIIDGNSSTNNIDGDEELRPLVFWPSSPFSLPELAGAASEHDVTSSDENVDLASECNVARTKTEDVMMKGAARGEERAECKHDNDAASLATAAAATTEAAAEAAAAAAAESIILSSPELTVLHGEIQSALRELVAAGFLDPLPEHVCRDGPSLATALAGVECCLRSPEIQTLLKRTGGGKTPTTRPQGKKAGRVSLVQRKAGAKGPDAVGGRRGMIEDLRRRLAGQQTLWGAKLPLVGEVERLVSASVESLGVDVTTGTRRAVDGRSGSASGGEFGRQAQKRQHWLVLVASDPRLVFKRALRLMYLTCNTGALSSGRVGAASVRGAGAAGALSSWSPGLSVAFGKTRYAPYACNPRARSFQGRDDFLRWEAAVELRCALDGIMAELPRGQSAGDTRPRVVNSEETDDEQETQLDTIPELVVLDCSDEEVGEAILVVKESEGAGETCVRASQEEGFGAVKEEEDIWAAMGGLEECVAEFFPEDTGGGREVVASVVPAAAAAAPAAGTSAAVAIALVCARCLHAHLGTPPTTLVSRPNAETGLEQGTSADDDEDENFLVSLQRACNGGADVSEAWPGPVNRQLPGTKEETEEEEGGGKPVNRTATVPPVCHTVDDLSSDDWMRQESDLQVPGHAGDSRNGDSDNALLPRAMGEKIPSGKFSPSQPLSREVAEIAEPARTEEDENRLKAGIGPSRVLGEVCCAVPEFLLQLEAGWVLASAVWEGVALLERARGYERAVDLLVQLLATRYTPHRRGRWWNRLSLDLAHIGRPRCALWAVEEGLRDPRVRGGDRLALEKRETMLASRVSNKTQATARAPSRPPPGASAGSTSPHPLTARGTPASVASVGSLSCSTSPASDPIIYPDGVTPRASAVVGDKDNGGEDDDDDDIFQDPIVERERRRNKKRRRKRRQQQSQQQMGKVVGGTDDDVVAGGGTSDVNQCTGSGPSVAVGAYSRTASCGSSGGVMEVVPHTTEGAHDACTKASDGTRDREVSGETSVGGGSGCGSSTAAASAIAAAVSAAAAAAAAAGAMRCEGLAELSDVPDLLRDESIGAVVLAATVEDVVEETERTAGKGGFGVPEMAITGRRLNREVGVKSRFVGYGNGATCTVESLVLQHLSQREEGSWAGWHCEGSPLRGLWALLMWDVLFMDVPDVFQTPFQDAPLDLDFCPLFYLNRREAVDARLAEVRAASPTVLSALVREAWITNAGTVCRCIDWQRTSVRYLQAVAVGLGGRAVAATLAALCLNHKHFGGGLPDLLLMRAVRTSVAGDASSTGEGSTASAGRALATVATAQDSEVSTPERFVSWLGVDYGALDEARVSDGGALVADRAPVGVGSVGGAKRTSSAPPFEAIDLEGLRVETWLLEVKGPSDRLSDRQTAWLKLLDRGGARVGVCHVAEGSGGSHAHKSSVKGKRKTKTKAEPAC